VSPGERKTARKEAGGERAAGRKVRLRPQNPFDLIRLLARSQSDPRKAVAELVQNSLDAGARHVEVTWFNERGRRALRILDDGEGVFPELGREQALRRIARTIGHSHKLDLTPAERREQMVLGRYGIGLIGFWNVGEALEIKSRVGGGGTFVLRLREERATAEVVPARSRRVEEPQTYTEVTIRAVHEGVMARIRPARLQAFLANELRGQLLERGATVRIRDRVARGRAKKLFVVEPRPYLGQPIEGLRELEIPGFEAARLELYLVGDGDERSGVVTLACGGTVVLDDIALIDGDDSPRAPWTSGRVEGVIDFPELSVAPSTRRGFVHDEPVAAFLAALEGLERALLERLEAEARRRARQRDENLAKSIRRAFRSVVRRLPEYDFFQVAARREETDGPAPRPGGADGGESPSAGEALAASAPAESDGEAPAEADAAPDDGAPPEPQADGLLFPPGPLARLECRPGALRLAPGATRRLRVLALDADGRPCAGRVAFAFELDGPGELSAEGAAATYVAPELEPADAPPIAIRVRASQPPEGPAQKELELEVAVQLVLPRPSADTSGIPDPRPVSAPGAPWRSRVRDGVWEYNDAHRDYRAVAACDARRLRYLIHLFAKEVVLRNFGDPAAEETLERMVEVLVSLDAE